MPSPAATSESSVPQTSEEPRSGEERGIQREERRRRLVVAVPRDPQEPAGVPLVERSEHEIGERTPGAIGDAREPDAWRPQERDGRAEKERDSDPDEVQNGWTWPHRRPILSARQGAIATTHTQRSESSQLAIRRDR